MRKAHPCKVLSLVLGLDAPSISAMAEIPGNGFAGVGAQTGSSWSEKENRRSGQRRSWAEEGAVGQSGEEEPKIILVP